MKDIYLGFTWWVSFMAAMKINSSGDGSGFELHPGYEDQFQWRQLRN
ncbi:hypothetical protein [Ammoniphilus resinae]|uniref:Uncharacterized protein n=1 Tax=Ammoniphilus resinae TaxID=861532 RepID=A0ABS4GV17_9BACL|nr:hypothetical protein [Ammoniphilus resinae]MBP1934108.1 hypothetical protein [Ammoniphilus resinae]